MTRLQGFVSHGPWVDSGTSLLKWSLGLAHVDSYSERWLLWSKVLYVKSAHGVLPGVSTSCATGSNPVAPFEPPTLCSVGTGTVGQASDNITLNALWLKV